MKSKIEKTRKITKNLKKQAQKINKNKEIF